MRRYHETRRRHPVSSGSLLDGIREERKLLANLRELADRVIDTSQITVHELRQRLVELYGEAAAPGLSVNLLSFGYKFGVPYEADLVFDCRFLPNPFFVEGLKAQDGRSTAVRQFVVEQPEGRELTRAAPRSPGVPPAALPERGQGLPDGGGRLHRRAPPLGRAGGGAARVRRGAGHPGDRDPPGRGPRGLGSPDRMAAHMDVSPDRLPVRIDKPWGYEIWYAWTERYVGKILHVRRGQRLSLQYHREKDESSYLLRGRLLLTKGPSEDRLTVTEVGEGHAWRNRPGEIHTIEARRGRRRPRGLDTRARRRRPPEGPVRPGGNQSALSAR